MERKKEKSFARVKSEVSFKETKRGRTNSQNLTSGKTERVSKGTTVRGSQKKNRRGGEERMGVAREKLKGTESLKICSRGASTLTRSENQFLLSSKGGGQVSSKEEERRQRRIGSLHLKGSWSQRCAAKR